MTPTTPMPESIANVPLPEGTDALTIAIERLVNRTPEVKAADRAEIMKTVRKGRPLPPCKSFFEVVQGPWPGDETDEQINEALERLS